MALVEQTDVSPLPADTAVCLGAFDGLHLGHQALLQRARARSSRVGLVTFDPHPLEVLAPERAPRLLHTAVVRRRVCVDLGVDHLVLLPFSAAMAQMSAEQFVQQILIDGLRPRAVIIGEDFRFGQGRKGDPTTLRTLLGPAGIEVVSVPPVPVPESARRPDHDPEAKLGATAIRQAVQAGEVDRAGAMLGRWHAVAGTVVRGAQRGRTIGFPTANIEAPGALWPAPGVYAGALAVWSPDSELGPGPGEGALWPAVANLGHNPTFAGSDPQKAPLRLEVHVLDQDLGEQLYDLQVEFSFVARLRAEQRFDGPQALLEQIQRDVAAARPLLDGALDRAITPVP